MSPASPIHHNALILASVLQVLGIALPLMDDSLATALLSAVLFGGTFVGIVSLVLTMAGRYFPSKPARMMGRMTFSYSLAQILAPALIAVLANAAGTYRQGLYLASTAMLLGTALIVVLRSMAVRRHADAAMSQD